MRRLLFAFVLCACGQPQHLGSAPDAGSGTIGSSPDAGQDAGPTDAGPSDAGPPDAGPAADCLGLIPTSYGAALTFDVPAASYQVCTAATTDRAGNLAAETHDAGTFPAPGEQVNWTEVGANGASQGSFTGSYALIPEPVGFSGYSGGMLALWDPYGNLANFDPVEPHAAIGPGYSGGALAFASTASGVAVHRTDASGNETAHATVRVAGAPLGGAEDASGAVAIVLDSGQAAWLDLSSGKVSTVAIDGGGAAIARALTGGGVAVRLGGDWTALIKPFETTAAPAPSWLTAGSDFARVLNGRAYAVWNEKGNAIAIVSAQGNSCGALTFSGVTSVTVGGDGTVIGASGLSGCSKTFWRGLLK